MKIYLVGGAVRDELLGRPISERDWVVVGATENQILELGYKKVGKDFPVFLHPVSHEEYALARTERKTGKGYTSFIFHADPKVTLEEDLMRRDLTINAMAKTADGKIIDPFHGQEDLKNKTLRHVSPAFVEDPVRILRVARFAAKFGEFTVDESTLDLMGRMLKRGEVDALVPDRVWQEFQRALTENNPERFFEVLHSCRILAKLFPEIESELAEELISLKRAVKLSNDAEVRFAALVQHLDKNIFHNLCDRYPIPNAYKNLSDIVIDNKIYFQNANEFQAEETLEFVGKVDAFRRVERFKQFLLACESALENIEFPSSQYKKLESAFEKAKNASIAHLDKSTLSGEEIREEMHNTRLAAIKV